MSHKPPSQYERKCEFSIDKIFDAIDRGKSKFGGSKGLKSRRLAVYRKYGTRCVYCGLEGSFFAVERFRKRDYENAGWHFNLYAEIDKESTRLMTIDHLIPISKGGKYNIENLRPACQKCNSRKGNLSFKDFSDLKAELEKRERISEFKKLIKSKVMSFKRFFTAKYWRKKYRHILYLIRGPNV